MIARALKLYGTEDPRSDKPKESMFELLQTRKTIKQQILEVQGHFKATIDLTQEAALILVGSLVVALARLFVCCSAT